MNNINLELLDKILFSKKSSLPKKMQNGISEKEFLNVFKRYFAMPCPEELILFYNWHNGVKVPFSEPVEKYWFLSKFYMNTIDEVQLILSSNDYKLLDKNFFPFASSGHGEHLSVRIEKNINTSSMVYLSQLYDASLDVDTTIYDSLDILIISIIECFNNEAYKIINDSLSIDVELEWKLCSKLNPKSDFWKPS